ncbi:MAG TPA: periplasmic heavy metal sensor [Myxococcota bacterium]
MSTSRSTLLPALGGLAVACLLAGMAAAQVSMGPRVGPGIPEVRLVERNAEQLGLDQKTIEAVQKLAAEAGGREEELTKQVREERLKLRDLLDEKLPDQAAVLKQLGVMSRLSDDMQKQQIETTLRLRKLLNDDQLTQLMELRKDARQQQRRRRPR